MGRLLMFSILLTLFACKSNQKATATDLSFLDTATTPRNDTVVITKETTRTDTVTLPPITITKTVQVPCPKSDTPSVVYKEVKADCPPPVTITKTVFKHDSITIYTFDSDKEKAFIGKIDGLAADNTVLKKNLDRAQKWRGNFLKAAALGWLLLAILVLLVYISYKRRL